MKKILINLLLPMIISAAKEALVAAGKEWHEAQPDIVKQVLLALYPVIDIQLENYAATTETKVDDNVADKLKSVCEELAKEIGLELPNLDAGTAND